MTLDTQAAVPPLNPYVGPRSLQRGEVLYGRRSEVNELFNLLVAERIVLLYSPSGAGKTSLVQAGLTPLLESRRFQVLPIVRVHRTVTPTGAEQPINRYTHSLLLYLEEMEPGSRQITLPELATLTLDEYFTKRFPDPTPDATTGATPYMLIIDQFEEILTLDPTDIEAKHAFFRQLTELVMRRWLWVLLVLREDHVAGLDPYRFVIPTRLTNRLRLELLGRNPALAAIQGPARQAGVEFTDAAARKLVDSLRQQLVLTSTGTLDTQLGPHVEPVQLQVVCRRIWENLPPGATIIEETQIQEAGTVDQALADYYAEQVQLIAQETDTSERSVREWIEEYLITAQGLRGQVLQEQTRSEGMENRVLWKLVDAHLLRAEERRGGIWFELAHDRMVGPIRANNQLWSEQHLSVLQRQAKLWDEEDHRPDFLLIDIALDEQEQWAAEHRAELTALEHEYLAACQQARSEAEHDRRQAARIRWLAIGASITAFIAVIMLILAAILYGRMVTARNEAISRELAAAAVANLDTDPELSLRLALHGFDVKHTDEAVNALHLALQFSRVEHTLDAAPDAEVRSIAFQPDGAQVATASADGQVKFWNVATGAEVFTLPRIDSGVVALSFSSDNKFLATAEEDGKAHLWNLTDPLTPILTLSDTAPLRSIVFSPNSKQLVTAGNSGTAILWDVATGKALRTLMSGGDAINQATFHPTDPCLATVDQSGVKLWDTETGNRLLGMFKFSEEDTAGYKADARSIAISPNGNLLLLGGTATDIQSTTSKILSIQDCRNLQLLWKNSGHSNTVNSVAFDATGRRFATASSDGTVIVRDVVSRELLFKLSGSAGKVNGVAFSPDGKHLATAHGSRIAKIWNAAAIMEELPTLIGHQLQVQSLTFYPDGKHLLSASSDGSVGIWNVISGTLVYSVSIGAQVLGVDVSPDGAYFATGSMVASATVWANDSHAKVFTVPSTDSWATAVAFSPDGTQLAVSHYYSSTAELWDITTHHLVQTFVGHDSILLDLDFSPDGKQIATASADGTARIWQVATGQPLFQPLHRNKSVYAVAFSPDSSQLLTAGDDQRVILWDTHSGNQLHVFAHNDRVLDVAFSNDEKLFASVSGEYVKVWELLSYREILSLPILQGSALSTEFSLDSKRLAVGLDNGVIRQFAVDIDDLRRLANQRAPRVLTSEECFRYLHDVCPRLP